MVNGMMTEEQILYEIGDYWVAKADISRKGYEVWRIVGTHSRRCAVIGYTGPEGLQRAIDEANKRDTATGKWVES